MRVLVTGANGFIGRHLVRALATDHEIIAVTRTRADVLGATEVRVVPGIDSKTDWNGVLNGIDVVLHLAARVHVMHETASDPLESFREVNTRGTRRLAEGCVHHGVRRLVFMSSIKVNGEETRDYPFTADTPPAPLDPYGESKWEAELALREISEKTGLETVVLRPTVVYGIGVKGNIQRIIKLIMTRVPLPIRSVRNRRTMLSVANLAHWVSRAINEDQPPSGPVLVGDPEPVSTPELVRSLAEGLGVRPFLVPVPVQAMNAAAKILGRVSLAQRLFGNLESVPTFAAFPGIRAVLESSSTALNRLGGEMKELAAKPASRSTKKEAS